MFKRDMGLATKAIEKYAIISIFNKTSIQKLVSIDKDLNN